MAMYENLGYCPNNEFWNYLMDKGLSELSEKALDILGDRIGYMVYLDPNYSFDSYSYILYALAESSLCLDIAKTLVSLIPECTYAKTGRLISCHDLNDVKNFPVPIVETNGIHIIEEHPEKTFFFEDERFVILIQDEDYVQIYLYKK